MVRPKKDAVLNGEGAETAVENGNVEAEGAKKGKGRPKKNPDAPRTAAKDALPKRTLRSNSKTTLDAVPVEFVEEKKPKKAAPKSKKVADTNGSSDEQVNGDATTGPTKAKNGIPEAVQEKAAAAKGRKKVDKSPAANKVDSETDNEKTEPHTESNESDSAPESAEETPKPVKSTGATKGKKKAEKEPEAPIESDEELFPDEKKEEEKMEEDQEKVASGRGKKKAEKPKEKESKEEEPVAPKKAKKEPTKPKGKAASEEKATKPETKKAGGKGKAAAAAKDVAIEHWNADRVVKIFEPFCKSIPFAINENKPRRGSFEIVLRMQNGEEKIMWTGIKKGPPRSEKFPSDDQIKKLAEQYFVSELF